MLFTVRRPDCSSGFYHPAMRMFQPRRQIDLEDLILPTAAAMMAFAGPNFDNSLGAKNSPTKNISKQKNSFDVKVDVQHFSPEELDVKTVDNYIVVTGKHEEKQDDHGYISREFVRRYALPEGVKAEFVTCNLSSDGVLTISAPLQIENTPENEIKIPISFTGEPAKVGNEETKKEEKLNEEAVPLPAH